MADLPALRASDADREAAVVRLRDAHAEGRLTLEEFTARTELAYAARTVPELEPLLADLPAQLVARGGRVRRFFLALMGGPTVRGRWSLPRWALSACVLGGVDLDLTQVRFLRGRSTILCLTVLGGVDVVVPHGVDAELRGLAIMGGNDEHGESRFGAGAPRLRIYALTVLGGVDVRYAEPAPQLPGG